MLAVLQVICIIASVFLVITIIASIISKRGGK